MTTEITRAQVREALRLSQCSVPDFATREKATLTWNKVYISIQGGKLCFVELNYLQRIIRYLAGCCCYTDTIFTDKITLDKVMRYVHGIKTAPAYHDPIAMDLLPKAKTTSDYICLLRMLCREGIADNDLEVIADFEALLKRVEILKAHSQEDNFSEDFLSAAILLAKQKLKKNPKDEMWMSITAVLCENSTQNLEAISKNEALLREVLGLPQKLAFPSLKIRVPDKIKAVLKEGFEKANKEVITGIETLEDCLKTFDAFEKMDKELDNVFELLRPFLTQESGKQMVQDLRDRLIAHPAIIKAYLEDEKQIVNRLLYHADLSSITSPDEVSRQVREMMGLCREVVMNEINRNYEVIDIGHQSDSFSTCCDRYQKSTETTKSNVDNLSRDAEHQTLAEVRIKKEVGFTVDQYYKWIMDPQPPKGSLELKMINTTTGLKKLSKTTGRPVLVVYMEDKKWISGINLGSYKKPIVLNLDNKGIWRPVEKKK